VDRADGRFLFAKLYMDSLRSKQTLRHIQDALDSFPDNLDMIYEDALQRIKDQKNREDRALGMKTLSRVFCARRPLSLAELQHALAVEPGESDFDEYMDYDREDVLAACAGLINIDTDENAVRLVHLTLQTYLDFVSEKWIPRSEIEMAQVCLTYLNYDAFAEPCHNKDFEDRRKKYPLIAYASQYFGAHFGDAGRDPDLEAAALHLVSDPHRVAAYVQAAWFTDHRGSFSWDLRRGIDGLHVCAWLGLDKIIDELIDQGADVDVQETTFGQTPLMYASRAGHTETVRKLLNSSASVNIVSGRGRTTLFEAVAEDHEEVVELLLDQEQLDINAINPRESNRTVLMLAAHLGLFSVFDRLIEHPRTKNVININQRDSSGSTALSIATAKGHYLMVESLLHITGIEVNLQDNLAGRTALTLAAERNNTVLVELLLDSGADPMLPDKQGGGTALHRAVDYNCMAVIELIIQRKIDLKVVDNDGRGLLHSASTNGWPDMVRLLVNNGLKPNDQDKNGLTPLHDGSRAGNDNVTRTLLELGADRSIPDEFGRTARNVAWQYGNIEIMNALDGKKETETDVLSTIPQPEKLPGWSLSKLGLKDLIEQAIASGHNRLSEVEPISNDNALHHAVHGNHLDILKMLLTSHTLAVDDANAYHRTPLHLAAIDGNLEATIQLINANADLDLEDRWAGTPLFIAQINQHSPLAIALVEGGAKINSEKIDVQKLLFAAIQLGNIQAVEILLNKGANILNRNAEGLTPLQVAKEADQGEIMQLLVMAKTFNGRGNNVSLKESGEVEDMMPVMSPETEHRFVPFRSRPIVI
jgi:ankyrin repeat protein